MMVAFTMKFHHGGKFVVNGGFLVICWWSTRIHRHK